VSRGWSVHMFDPGANPEPGAWEPLPSTIFYCSKLYVYFYIHIHRWGLASWTLLSSVSPDQIRQIFCRSNNPRWKDPPTLCCSSMLSSRGAWRSLIEPKLGECWHRRIKGTRSMKENNTLGGRWLAVQAKSRSAYDEGMTCPTEIAKTSTSSSCLSSSAPCSRQRVARRIVRISLERSKPHG